MRYLYARSKVWLYTPPAIRNLSNPIPKHKSQHFDEAVPVPLQVRFLSQIKHLLPAMQWRYAAYSVSGTPSGSVPRGKPTYQLAIDFCLPDAAPSGGGSGSSTPAAAGPSAPGTPGIPGMASLRSEFLQSLAKETLRHYRAWQAENHPSQTPLRGGLEADPSSGPSSDPSSAPEDLSRASSALTMPEFDLAFDLDGVPDLPEAQLPPLPSQVLHMVQPSAALKDSSVMI